MASRERVVEERMQQLVREKEREAAQAHRKVCRQLVVNRNYACHIHVHILRWRRWRRR